MQGASQRPPLIRPMQCCGNEKKEKVMLTREEQQRVIDEVKKMIRQDRQRLTRLQKGTMSEKASREWENRDFDNLADLLKEVG
jgi:hypothetical protein